MTKTAMPSLKVGGARVEGRVGLGFVLDTRNFGGEDVEVFRVGKGALDEDGIAFICDPAASGVEMCGIVPTFIECEDRNESDAGVGDVENVSQLQDMTCSNA